MSIVLIYAGEIAEPIHLLTRLEDLHNESRAAILAEIKRREANGAPLDGLKDPGDFVPREDLDGITVKVRVLAEKKRRVLGASEAAALQRYLKLSDGPQTEDATWAAADGVYSARAAFVAAAVSEVDGAAGGVVRAGSDGLISESDLDAFERLSLNIPLYQVAQSVQGLGSKKAWRSGPSPART